MTKPSSQAIGNCNLKILLKYSTSTSGSQRANVIIQSGSWANNNTEFIGTITCNISESEIQVSGSSILIECTTDSSVKTSSCEYPLKKTPTPTFTISPASVSIPCSSTAPVTFTVNNVYNSPGTLSYYWSVSGWKKDGVAVNTFTTTTNTVNLVPNSFSPSNIYVWPVLNGVTQAQKMTTVSLAPFTNSLSITGNNAICPSTSAVYSVSDLGSGSTISWSTSNTSIATVTPVSGNQVTVNPVATQGTFNLIAAITNACGQQKTLTKTLTIGSPMFQINYVPRDLFIDLTLSPDYGSASLEEQGVDINTISWNKIAEEGGNVYFSGDGLYGTVLFPNNNSSITINVSLTNGCGTTSYPVVLMSGYADSRIGYSQPSISKISNDLYEIINVPEDTNKVKVSVYDIYGSMVFKTNTTNQINLSNLKAGIYVIKAQVKDKMITLKIIKN